MAEQTIRQKLKWQLIEYLARRLPPCKTMVGLFSESLERPLTLREKITAKLHLFTCKACRRYIEQIELMHHSLKPKGAESIVVEPAAKLPNASRDRIRAALEEAARNKN